MPHQNGQIGCHRHMKQLSEIEVVRIRLSIKRLAQDTSFSNLEP
jgi:hypothetical protein